MPHDLDVAMSTRDIIASNGPSIYDAPADAWSNYYYTAEQLEALLGLELVGSDDLSELPVRTRSKVAKTVVAVALGYQPPETFARTQPRLPHINADVYVQQSNNLQIWNAEIDAARRYIVIGLDPFGRVSAVRVIPGSDLANYDTTGILTSKFQAERRTRGGSRLVNDHDTERLLEEFGAANLSSIAGVSPVARPVQGQVVGIAAAYEALSQIVGNLFVDPGLTQERLRGAVVHRAACEALGLYGFADHGQFPDVLSQAIEIKPQLARTVDLGLELPTADTPIASLDGILSARDVRYAIFYGERLSATSFEITALVMTPGADFFSEYQQFGGLVSNVKLQMRLPPDFFRPPHLTS